MPIIDISLTETINGIKTSLSFSISHEVLMREVQAEQSLNANSHILSEELEEPIQAICSEMRTLLEQARLKLQICLISSYRKLLNDKEE